MAASKEMKLVPAKYNPYSVDVGQVWEDRSTQEDKYTRRLQIIGLAESEEGYKALVENLRTHKRTFILLSSFCARGTGGYRLVQP